MSLSFEIISVVLYCVIGLVSLSMAYKNFSASGFLPFHEKIAGQRFEDVGGVGLQSVITVLMRLTGLGFGVVGLQLILLPLLGIILHNPLLGIAGAVTGLLFCIGLFLINFQFHQRTNAATPWRGALYAAIALLIGIAITSTQL